MYQRCSQSKTLQTLHNTFSLVIHYIETSRVGYLEIVDIRCKTPTLKAQGSDTRIIRKTFGECVTTSKSPLLCLPRLHCII